MKWNSAVILSWGISYLVCAIVKPNIIMGLPENIGKGILTLISVLLLVPLLLESMYPQISKLLFFIGGAFESFGMVTSWVSCVVWNIPAYENQALFQISMAIMDWIAAIALFSKVKTNES